MPRIPAFSRVLVLFCGLALGLAAFSVAVQAAPAPSSPARQALETATNRILASIKNPDYVNPATRGPLRQQIEDEVLHIFDFGEFSSRTVGARWRSFTPQQQKQFSDAFADLLISTYVTRSTATTASRSSMWASSPRPRATARKCAPSSP